MPQYTPATIVKGDDLMLFDAQGHSLAYATSHVLTINGETADTSSKDHGIYGASEVNKITWEITSDNLYTDDAYNDMYDAMIAREAITVFFGHKSENDPDKTVADGDYEYWTKTATGAYTGKAFITSLVANANTGENATFNITLTGSGKLARVTAGG